MSLGLPDPQQNITTTTNETNITKARRNAHPTCEAQGPPQRLHLRLWSHLSLSMVLHDVVGQVVQAPDLTDGQPVDSHLYWMAR